MSLIHLLLALFDGETVAEQHDEPGLAATLKAMRLSLAESHRNNDWRFRQDEIQALLGGEL